MTTVQLDLDHLVLGVADMAARRSDWGWAVRTSDIVATAERLGLDVVPGSRVTPAGVELSYAALPVTVHPGRRGITRVELASGSGRIVLEPGL